MNDNFVHFKKADIVILAVVILIAVSFFVYPLALYGRSDERCFKVVQDGKTVLYPIDYRDVLTFAYGEVSVTVSFRDGTASVAGTNCHDRICEKTGVISKTGQIIVCVPCRLSV